MRTRPMVGALAGAMTCVLLVAACTTPSGQTPPAQGGAPAQSELGPFPLNVVVRQGKYEFALTQVRILAADAIVNRGPHLGPPDLAPERARPGHQLVDVVLDDRDTSMSPTPNWPYTDRRGVVATITATADGVAVPVKGPLATMGGSDDVSRVQYPRQFEFPDGTREALLHVTLSIDTSQTLVFRLW